jgi:hypothetical protein
MKKEIKTAPYFATEDEEREFWATNSAEDYVDFDTLVSVPPPMVPRTPDAVFLQLPHSLFLDIEKVSQQKSMSTEEFIEQLLTVSMQGQQYNKIPVPSRA